MTWNRTILTGAVLVAMILLAILDRRIVENRIYDQVSSRSVAHGVDASQVQEIRLKNREGETLLVREGGNAWRMKSPLDAPADPEIVESLLINVTAANRTNDIDPQSLAEYGLNKPETEVVLVHTSKDGQRKEFALQLGNDSTYTGLVFAKYPNDRKVFTVGQHVKNTLGRGARDFRRSRLFDIATGDLDSYRTITLKDRTAEIVLKNDAGKWRLEQPFAADAEPEIVREYLRKVGLLRASSFVTEKSDRPTSLAAAMQALTSPTLVATFLRAGEKEPQTLMVATAEGNAGPVVVARRDKDPEVLALRSETLEDLHQDAHFFRSRAVFSLSPKDAGALRVRIGHAVTELVRNESGHWELKGQPNAKVDQEEVEARLQSLLRSRVRAFVDGNPTNPGDYGIPRFSFTVTSRDGSKAETLETGSFEKGDPTHAYARRTGDKAVFTTEMSKDLIITPDQVTDRHFARIAPPQLKRVELEMDGGKPALVLEDGEWKLQREGQAPATIDRRRVDRFFDYLNSLVYERDLSASGETVITPPAESPLTVRVFGEGEKPVLEFTTGRRVAEATYVTVAPNRTMEVKSQDIDRLRVLVDGLVK